MIYLESITNKNMNDAGELGTINYKEAGMRIMLLRDKHCYTRKELSQRSGMSSKFIYEIETGRKGFSARTLLRLSETFGVSCDYILTGDERTSDRKDL